MNDTDSAPNPALDTAKAELTKVMTDTTHPDHALYMRGDPAVHKRIGDLYAKAVSETPIRPKDAPNASQGTETEDLIEEDPVQVETTFRREWGPDYDARWAGVVNVAEQIASHDPQLYQLLSRHLGDELGIRALDYIRQHVLSQRI